MEYVSGVGQGYSRPEDINSVVASEASWNVLLVLLKVMETNRKNIWLHFNMYYHSFELKL
ncbi:hypothetical protein Fmac_011172 [Flemingia macrophylla]|uniref:Uncharacterized protein n=1 Tax=Flemingia macrophylla TaxID=520843 RepID=A0ABD1MLN9_9FABA